MPLQPMPLFEAAIAWEVIQRFCPLFTTEQGRKWELRRIGNGIGLFAGEALVFAVPENDYRVLAKKMVDSLTRPKEDFDMSDVCDHPMFDDDGSQPSPTKAARKLGSIRTPRKTTASRANMERLNATRPVKPCTCQQTPHKSTCPVYQREAQQRSRARKQA